jgi:N utilization substance protein A
MKSEFLIAVTQLASERNLPRDTVLSAIEAALASAYKKDNQVVGQNISVRLNAANGEVKVYTLKEVVEEVIDADKEMTLKEAQKIKTEADLGDTVEIETTTYNAGRIAAQTAKQVVMQRLREAERELVFEEFSRRAGDVVSGIIQRMEPRQIVVDVGRAEAVLPISEQVPLERYRPGQRLKVHVLEVRRSSKGPEIIVSRSHRDLLKRLFEIEVPEIFNGVVEIKAVAREAGSRSKVAVEARQAGVDPVGSCVGLRGVRIQNIVNELQGEKIDVVQWHKDLPIFIANALSPSQVLRVDLDEERKSASVIVPDKQLSLAIGREGQNARLGAKLCGWKIDIKSASEVEDERLQRVSPEKTTDLGDVEVAELIDQTEQVAEDVILTTVNEVGADVEIPEPISQLSGEEPPSDQTVPVISPEEALAALSVQEDITSKEVEEEDIGTQLTEEIWKIPSVATVVPSGIRFAEDIIERRPPKESPGRKGGKKSGRGNPPGRQQGGR